ncbi:hypothetical protein Tco_1215488 [Tanacetum coccineum]
MRLSAGLQEEIIMKMSVQGREKFYKDHSSGGCSCEKGKCNTKPPVMPKLFEEDAEKKPTKMDESRASDKDRKDEQATRSEFERLLQQEEQTENHNSTNSINTVSTTTNL